MARIHLVSDGPEILRRRRLVPPGRLVEVWQDLYVPGDFWIGETSKGLLDGAETPLPARLTVEERYVPIYYGPRICDDASLPREESLRSRVLSAHGIGVAWITLDQLGQRAAYESAAPTDPIFFLRAPGGAAAHVWRLFQSRSEAEAYMAEYYGKDPEAREWAQALPADSHKELLKRHAIHD
jgi:hypothetical protein